MVVDEAVQIGEVQGHWIVVGLVGEADGQVGLVWMAYDFASQLKLFSLTVAPVLG